MRIYFTSMRGIVLAAAMLTHALGSYADQPKPASRQDSPGQTTTASPAMPAPPPLQDLNAFQGKLVRAIEVKGIEQDSRIWTQIRDLIVQETGQPLGREKIRRSLQDLYATGRFSDVQVDEESVGDGVTLTFTLSPNYFIGSVTSVGAPARQRPTNSQLIDASKLELGEVLTRGKVDQAMQRMKTVLQANGFYRASIEDSEKFNPQTQVAAVHFEVTPGEPAQIGQLIVEGDPGYSPAEIVNVTKMQPGRIMTQDRLTRAQQRLRKQYSKQNRLESQISIIDRTYHPDTNQVDFVFRIVRGPTVDVRLEGANVSRRKLKKYVPVYEENAVDNDLLNEGRRNIRDYLQTKGYFDAKVNFSEDYAQQNDHLNVIYDVDRGDKHTVVKVTLDINPGQYIATAKVPPYFDLEDLQQRLQVQSKNFVATQGRFRNFFQNLATSHGRFSQTMMNDDVQNLTALYQASGFLQAKVEGAVQDDYKGDAGDIAVTYKIDEGPQTRVVKLIVEGNKHFTSDRILGLLNTTEGQPYSQANLDNDRDLLVNLYFDDGFPNAQLDVKASPTPNQANSMDVTYTIREGEQFFADRILMSQLHFTKPSVAEKQFAIKPGDPLSQNLMSQTQANLYNLGIFNAVKMGVQNPDGNAKYKDVLLQLQEARRWTFNYGFGLEASTGQPSQSDCARLAQQGQSSVACSQGRYGVSPRVSFDVSRINFRGRAHTLTLQTSIGRLEQRVLFNDEVRRFFDKPNWVFSFTAFYDNSINVTTFTSERLEGSLQLRQTYSRVSQFLYRFTYRRVKASNVVVSTDQIPIYSAPVRVAIPSFTWIRDKRDNVIDSHNGNFTTFDTGVASRYFGSQASFGRFLIQNTTYHPFGRHTASGETTMWVLARNTRIGVAEPFANTVIPLPERFLAGGANSLRGYALNQAGPRDLQTGSPLGGDAILTNSLELRTPPVGLPFVGNNLSFEFFSDIGNVFADGSEMIHGLFRFYQPNADACGTTATRCNFSYMSNAVGSGIRYRTPIGPVRVDLGYNLNPTIYPLGSTVDNVTTYSSHTTQRLNFFFSIGQTF